MVEYDCEIQIDGEPRTVHIISRSMWSSDEVPQYTGAIGKIVERKEETL